MPVTIIAPVRFPATVSVAVAPGSVKAVWMLFVNGFAPSKVITGGVASCTVTVNVLVAMPFVSVAVTVTVVMPSGNVEPEAGVFVVVTAPLESVAEVVKFTTAPDALVASAIMFDGTVMIGGGRSPI